MTLRASQCHSLKEKRALLRKLDSRVRARFRIPLAEVGAQDDCQSAILGFAVVGASRTSVERTSAAIARFIEGLGLAELVYDEHETTIYGDGPMDDDGLVDIDLESDDPLAAEWVPETWKLEDEQG